MVLNGRTVRNRIQNAMPRRNNISGLQSGRATARDDILLGIRPDDRDFEFRLVLRKRKCLVSVLQHHDTGCGDFSAEFSDLGGIAGPLDAIAKYDLRVPLCLLLDKLQEVGNPLVNGRDAKFLARQGMEDKFWSPPPWRAWHFKIQTSVDGLVNAIGPKPLVVSVKQGVQLKNPSTSH